MHPTLATALAAALLLAGTVSAHPCMLTARAKAFLELVSQRNGGARTLGKNLWRTELGLQHAQVGFCEWEIAHGHRHHHAVMIRCRDRSNDCRTLFEEDGALASGCVYVPGAAAETSQDKK